MNDRYRGMQFSCMSDTYLLQCFDELCEMTSESRPNSEDWMDEWRGAKEEILSRMKSQQEAA